MKWLIHKLQERWKYNKWKTVFIANFTTEFGGIVGAKVKFNQYKQRYKVFTILPDEHLLSFSVKEFYQLVESAEASLTTYQTFSDAMQYWNVIERSKRDNSTILNHSYPISQD